MDWNPDKPKQFVSGSTDCRILIFDIDLPDHILELTKSNIGMNFDSTLGVECVKYNPHNVNQVASCQRNGTVSLWDIRYPKPMINFQAHIGNTLCLDWHPVYPDVLLSGGQDKQIKIWNLKQHNTNTRVGMKPMYQVMTQTSVRRCEWNKDIDLMTTSISTEKSENKVSLWHLKKPYLQQYVFKGNPGSDFSDFQWIEPG